MVCEIGKELDYDIKGICEKSHRIQVSRTFTDRWIRSHQRYNRNWTKRYKTATAENYPTVDQWLRRWGHTDVPNMGQVKGHPL